MKARVEYIMETFGAGEVARIADVSVNSQKDWRRHGITSAHDGKGRVRTTVADLLMLAFLSYIGKNINDLRVSRSIADSAAEAAFSRLASLPGKTRYVLDGGGEWSPTEEEAEAMQKAFHDTIGGGAKYLFVPLPYSEGRFAAIFIRDMREFEKKCAGIDMGLLLDMERVVDRIAARIPGHVVTYRKCDLDKWDPDRPDDWHGFRIFDPAREQNQPEQAI